MKTERELDDQLEQGLNASATGRAPLDGDSDLAGLVQLAQAVRDTPHPELSRSAKAAAQARLMETARQLSSQPTARPAGGRAWSFRLTGAIALVLMLFATLAGGAAWWYGPLSAHAAGLADLTGTVEIAPAGSTQWHTAQAGETLQNGETIRTGADGQASLAFFEGSRATLGPNTEIDLSQLGGRWGNVLQVELNQIYGSSRYNIVPFQDSAAHFVVDTPSGSASVHGTVFEVSVNAQGQALFTVDRGRVGVANANGQVTVNAGQATRANPGAAPLAAAYRFATSATLDAINGDTWSAAGLTFDVGGTTFVAGAPHIGQTIFISGRILDKGHWVADTITVNGEPTAPSVLTGTLGNNQPGSLVVGGTTVNTDTSTSLDADLQPGDPVLVVFASSAAGHTPAAQILKLEEGNGSSQALCTGANPQPEAQTLAARYAVPYTEIMGWFCQGFGFGEIDQAYGLGHGFGKPVADIFAMRQQGLGWGELRHDLQLTGTPVASASPQDAPTGTLQPTDTAALTDTATPSQTLTPTSTGTATQPAPVDAQPGSSCSGSKLQPKAQALAAQYGVSYGEIMGWFCQGFGFGEIDQAYSISTQDGASVSEIMAMKKSGQDWSTIKKNLNHGKKGEHGKP